MLCASVSASIGPARQKLPVVSDQSIYPHGCESCEISGEIFYSCPTPDMQGECIDAWMNNKLQNGCFGNAGNEECLAMGCIPNSAIHTFTETCAGGNAPCPDPYHLEHNNGSVNFLCPDAEAEVNCQATYGPDFHMGPCLEQGCVLSDDSTYEEWCASPSHGTGLVGNCPSDCNLMQNNGYINFHCPDQESEAMCHATFGPNFTLNECLHLGCVLTEDSTYQEWCEGGSCGYPGGNGTGGGGGGTGGTGTGGSPHDPCPSGMTIQNNGGVINFVCPDADAEANCQAPFGEYFHMNQSYDHHMESCIALGCVLSDDSTYEEWCVDNTGDAVPTPGPNGCPAGFEIHGSGSKISFNCPDQDSEDQCHSTYGPDFTMYTCLSLGCVLTDDSDFQEWCEPTTGNNPYGHQCPVGTYPHNNGGALWFDCPDPTVMDQCRETFPSNDYSYMLAMCTSYGCVQSADSDYDEWCEDPGIDLPDGHIPVPGPNGCPPGFEIHHSGGAIWFHCPDQNLEDQCVSTFGPDFYMHNCLSLGCVLDENSDYQEWCKPSTPATTHTPVSHTPGPTHAPDLPDGHIPVPGPDGCPSGFEVHHSGTVLFICPDADIEAQCQSTYGPDFYMHTCLSLGCVLDESATYQESCVPWHLASTPGPTWKPTWEPLPLCPEWSNYKFDGDIDAIDWQCENDANHQACLRFIASVPNDPVYGLQNAIRDCWFFGNEPLILQIRVSYFMNL